MDDGTGAQSIVFGPRGAGPKMARRHSGITVFRLSALRAPFAALRGPQRSL